MDVAQTRGEIIEGLFNEYGNAIYRYVRYTLPGGTDASDIVQDVFMRAFHAWDEFEGRSNPKTWLFKIARNCTYDTLRKRQTERTYIQEQHHALQFTSLDTLVELEDALQQLSFSDRQVLNLRLIQDLTVAETAKILGWTEGKVRVEVHRARKRLQAILVDAAPVDYHARHGRGEVPMDEQGQG